MRSCGVLAMCTRIWLTIGLTVQAPRRLWMSSRSKFDTPIARSLPASYASSRARHASRLALEVAVLRSELAPRLGAVDDHQVEVVKPHRLERPVNRLDGVLIGLHLGSELGRHEDLVSAQAAGPDSLADALFVAVRLRGVDVAIADLRGLLHGGGGIGVVDEPGPESELRDLDAVRQRVGLFQDHDVGSVSYWASVTCSPQVTGLPVSSFCCIAMWTMKRSGAAPCQWCSSGSKKARSPGRMNSTWPPSRWQRPTPSVTKIVWPCGWVCHAVRAPGVKCTAAAAKVEVPAGAATASM